jgi:uncharacterized protein involved in outer membrane biogenesis
VKFLRFFKWPAISLLVIATAATVFILLFGWNWLRQPIEQYALNKTGRVLSIKGDLTLGWHWPLPRITARDISFSNPSWAKEPLLFKASSAEIEVDFLKLLQGRFVFPQVHLENAAAFLEQNPDGRKSWLLDLAQKDEAARTEIGRITLDEAKLGYDDISQKTRIRADISSISPLPTASPYALTVAAEGQFKGNAFKAKGSGGPAIAIRDETTPYPLKVEASIGRTHVNAEGTATGLLKLSTLEMKLALRGDNLDQLFPIIGIATPRTRPYAVEGRLQRAGNEWNYQDFKGRFGESDIAGSAKLTVGGQRPIVVANLTSNVLDIDDLGPLIGARQGSVKAARQAADVVGVEGNGNGATNMPADTKPTAAATPARMRVLPDLPFKTDRWNSLDAEVNLRAKTIRRAAELPLENLRVHMLLRNAVVTLDPLDFGVAGGHLNALITLDGSKRPIQATARVKAQKLLIAKLFPSSALNKASIGQINGVFDLKGRGDSVGQMLATSEGKIGLVAAGGQISRLMMEKAGLHLWEMLQLNLAGDQLIELRCAVADFDVKAGILRSNALILDTQVTTITGTGTIDLAREQLDLTLNQRTKKTSPLALRSPLILRGSFVKPVVGVDKGKLAARAVGAVALGLVNPLLALIPLVDPGPGKDSDCGPLLSAAKTSVPPEKGKSAAQK